ncbi:hypothetical protein [Streptomyces sp. XD-27]|uniref:hypothetical protein n=1 Tax=Streptomyces sp. XD-27 TaxID=3062779 RepID=UPI0026F45A1F|nr:hypothetical protein [Streptomyces sp. XD-27]WKX71003.1 hypothetical protein Q3Y56_14770 [Streptomyces sp. XD-27]
MYGKRSRILARWAVGAAALAAGCALPAGTAQADESPHHSHNGSRFALINTGQIDDPAEDVLEHFQVVGGDHNLH